MKIVIPSISGFDFIRVNNISKAKIGSPQRAPLPSGKYFVVAPPLIAQGSWSLSKIFIYKIKYPFCYVCFFLKKLKKKKYPDQDQEQKLEQCPGQYLVFNTNIQLITTTWIERKSPLCVIPQFRVQYIMILYTFASISIQTNRVTSNEQFV